MRSLIRKLVNATNVIDHAYLVKGRSMALKPNIVVLFYALANEENLSQSQLHHQWLLPLSTINTIVSECRSAGYITLEPIPGKRRECYLRLTGKGRKFADIILSEIHAAEEYAMRKTAEKFSVPDFVEALEFYAETFHRALKLNADGRDDDRNANSTPSPGE